MLYTIAETFHTLSFNHIYFNIILLIRVLYCLCSSAAVYISSFPSVDAFDCSVLCFSFDCSVLCVSHLPVRRCFSFDCSVLCVFHLTVHCVSHLTVHCVFLI